jgi:hypothetical protein
MSHQSSHGSRRARARTDGRRAVQVSRDFALRTEPDGPRPADGYYPTPAHDGAAFARPESFDGAGRPGMPAVAGQDHVVSRPNLRFLTLAAVVLLSVVLSVTATLAVIAVMNAGVILPAYARYDQPAQVSQLGICVNNLKHKVSTPTNLGFCGAGSTFVHVQPDITHP